jgi:hypothetical protein
MDKRTGKKKKQKIVKSVIQESVVNPVQKAPVILPQKKGAS